MKIIINVEINFKHTYTPLDYQFFQRPLHIEFDLIEICEELKPLRIVKFTTNLYKCIIYHEQIQST